LVERQTVLIAWQQQPTSQKIVYSGKQAPINRKKEQCLMKDCGKPIGRRRTLTDGGRTQSEKGS
jgi:hypothetical protein